MRMMTSFGNEYCDVCRDYFDIQAAIDEDPEEECPQLYINGFHVHVDGEVVSLPIKCIWITAPNTINEMLETLRKRA